MTNQIEQVAAAGDVYVLPSIGDDVALEWLIVRDHADDPSLVLMVPADDFPLAGTPDFPVSFRDSDGERSLTVRCGECVWYPRAYFGSGIHVGSAPESVVAAVRRRVHDLALGEPVIGDSASRSAECDPEYEDWMALVRRTATQMRHAMAWAAQQAGHCGAISRTEGYAPCSRNAGHVGPCEHRLVPGAVPVCPKCRTRMKYADGTEPHHDMKVPHFRCELWVGGGVCGAMLTLSGEPLRR